MILQLKIRLYIWIIDIGIFITFFKYYNCQSLIWFLDSYESLVRKDCFRYNRVGRIPRKQIRIVHFIKNRDQIDEYIYFDMGKREKSPIFQGIHHP